MLDFSRIEIGKKYERPWLASEWGFASFHAIAKGVFCPRGGGQIVLFVTRTKQDSQEQYADDIRGDHLYWEGEKGHGNDNRILNAEGNHDEIHLFYRDIHHAPFEYKGLIEVTSARLLTNKPSEFVFRFVR